MGKSKEDIDFEKALEKLESIVATLEKGDCTLKESMEIFEEGMKLVKLCELKLNEAERLLQKLVKENDGEFRLEQLDNA